MKTIIEPFRTKVVEPIYFTSQGEREALLASAGYNLFKLNASDCTIDFLTDSGTAALSSDQWSALMRADESYAGASSFHRFEKSVKSIFGFKDVLPVHQGRAAERLLFSELVKPGQKIPSNTHFDTTRANLEARGATAVDLPCRAWADGDSAASFAGNIDLAELERLICEAEPGMIPFAMLTVTNNACGGQPVSMRNIRQTGLLLKRHQIPLFIDAARFAENAYLIQQREEKYSSSSISTIVEEMFKYADGCLMSCKKDGIANIGGFIALNDAELVEKLKVEMIVTEGFPTYGGLSGRDLETIAIGLYEATNEDYLRYREASARFLHDRLRRIGIPVISPPALHAVYVDAAAMLPHIPPLELPGQALACELYCEAGIRTCEIGTAMFGKSDPETGSSICAPRELVRLALPRRVYSQSHYEYVIEAFSNINQRRSSIRGLKITKQAEKLRHFTAVYEPIEKTSSSINYESEMEGFNVNRVLYEI